MNQDGHVLQDDWYPGAIPSSVQSGRDVYVDSSYGFDACHTTLDKGVKIGDATGVYDRATLIVGPLGELTIGKFVCLNGTTVVANRSVRIGDHCLLAWGVVITDTSVGGRTSVAERRALLHAIVANELRPPVPEFKSRPVVIEDNVWIGFDSVILPGVRIGRGAVVGCKSVVDHDVAAFHVVAGNPACTVALLSPYDGQDISVEARRSFLGNNAFADLPAGAAYLTGLNGGRITRRTQSPSMSPVEEGATMTPTTNDQLLQEFRATACEVLAVPPEDLSLDVELSELDADSLDLIELIRVLEDEHGIMIQDEELRGIRTLRDAYSVLSAKLTAEEPDRIV